MAATGRANGKAYEFRILTPVFMNSDFAQTSHVGVRYSHPGQRCGSLPAGETMTSKSTSEKRAAGKRQWRVRTEKGDVFGPADLATLQAWARDGRLAPTHQICADGATWEPVTALRELEMDWVAEVTSGSFYGPIHRDAMNELLREGSINAAAPRFQRSPSEAATAKSSVREQELERALHDQQQQASRRLDELEKQLAAARGEHEQTKAALGAKDFEFDAERQEQRASAARLQAELLKRDARLASLEAELHRVETLTRERQELETRQADQAREATRLRDELDQTRRQQHEAERTATVLQERVANHENDTAALHDSVRTLKLRLESARKLVQQAGAALGGVDEAIDAEIVETPTASGGTIRNGPPPQSTPAGGMKPGMSLADLEAQAQRELRQLGQKGGGLFKGRAKG